MKTLVVIAVLTAFAVGCASAVPISRSWTYPQFNAVGMGLCAATTDTLKDLARIELYAQDQGRSDSVLVFAKLCAGLQGRADSTVVDQKEGTRFYWLYAFDALGNRSCQSNVTMKTVVQPPEPATMR